MNFFSYESKPMQILMYIADLVILNVLFVLCSIPIFTIGASHAALYSAIRTLQDPEDDTSVTKAFFAWFWLFLFSLPRVIIFPMRMTRLTNRISRSKRARKSQQIRTKPMTEILQNHHKTCKSLQATQKKHLQSLKL